MNKIELEVKNEKLIVSKCRRFAFIENEEDEVHDFLNGWVVYLLDDVIEDGVERKKLVRTHPMTVNFKEFQHALEHAEYLDLDHYEEYKGKR